MDTVMLAAVLAAAFLPLCAGASQSSHAKSAAHEPGLRLIGYYDANAQQELSADSLRNQSLTHVVLTNAVKVDNNGTVHYRARGSPSEKTAEELVQTLAKLPGVKLVVSFRGEPDDVALDELAEVDEARQRFATSATFLARSWNASGFEIEWHSDDPAGGKASAAPFDVMEQYHFALLCRDLSSSLRAVGDKTLSVAVRPGRQEFADGAFVRSYINWLTLRAYSMRSLGDPHHSSLKDMSVALDEWFAKGVLKNQLVLGTPLFGRPGASLHSAGDRNEALRKTWRELSHGALRPQRGKSNNGDGKGDVFLDASTGKVWWVSGINTTKAKVKHLLQDGYGGIAIRDLHQDASEKSLSLVQAVRDAVQEHHAASKRRPKLPLAAGIGLFQKGLITSRTEGEGASEGGDRSSEL